MTTVGVSPTRRPCGLPSGQDLRFVASQRWIAAACHPHAVAVACMISPPPPRGSGFASGPSTSSARRWPTPTPIRATPSSSRAMGTRSTAMTRWRTTRTTRWRASCSSSGRPDGIPSRIGTTTRLARFSVAPRYMADHCVRRPGARPTDFPATRYVAPRAAASPLNASAERAGVSIRGNGRGTPASPPREGGAGRAPPQGGRPPSPPIRRLPAA